MPLGMEHIYYVRAPAGLPKFVKKAEEHVPAMWNKVMHA